MLSDSQWDEASDFSREVEKQFDALEEVEKELNSLSAEVPDFLYKQPFDEAEDKNWGVHLEGELVEASDGLVEHRQVLGELKDAFDDQLKEWDAEQEGEGDEEQKAEGETAGADSAEAVPPPSVKESPEPQGAVDEREIPEGAEEEDVTPEQLDELNFILDILVGVRSALQDEARDKIPNLVYLPEFLDEHESPEGDGKNMRDWLDAKLADCSNKVEEAEKLLVGVNQEIKDFLRDYEGE